MFEYTQISLQQKNIGSYNIAVAYSHLGMLV